MDKSFSLVDGVPFVAQPTAGRLFIGGGDQRDHLFAQMGIDVASPFRILSGGVVVVSEPGVTMGVTEEIMRALASKVQHYTQQTKPVTIVAGNTAFSKTLIMDFNLLRTAIVGYQFELTQNGTINGPAQLTINQVISDDTALHQYVYRLDGNTQTAVIQQFFYRALSKLVTTVTDSAAGASGGTLSFVGSQEQGGSIAFMGLPNVATKTDVITEPGEPLNIANTGTFSFGSIVVTNGILTIRPIIATTSDFSVPVSRP